MAQPHRPTAPSTPSSSGVTEGLPASVTATSPQVAAVATAGHPAAAGGRPGRRRGLILVACAVLGSVLGVAAQRLPTGGSTPTAAPAPSPSATASVSATIAAFTSQGSSFTERDGVWRSQTYKDATFGGLKKGIGLRLDLGTARTLTSVTFTAQTGPTTVELRAGDSVGSDGSAYQLVGSAVQATGATTLPAAAGGSHRYWVIWMTRLPPGLQARIADPVARG